MVQLTATYVATLRLEPAQRTKTIVGCSLAGFDSRQHSSTFFYQRSFIFFFFFFLSFSLLLLEVDTAPKSLFSMF